MDAESIYTLLGIIIFILVAYFTLKNNTADEVQTKEEKRYEIISQYKAKLLQELTPIEDKEKYVAKKTLLLKEFSDELSRNIFFDAPEVKEIIQDLATQSKE